MDKFKENIEHAIEKMLDCLSPDEITRIVERHLKNRLLNNNLSIIEEENWNPDWKGDPNDPQRWKGW